VLSGVTTHHTKQVRKKESDKQACFGDFFLKFNLIETDLPVIMAHSEGQFESN
jgi:hypothetical protein